MRTAIAATLLVAGLACPALAQQKVETFEGAILGPKGDNIGKLTIRGGENATVARIVINAGGLSPGWHGIHFHQVGDCSDPGKYEMSKGHVDHSDVQHGLLNPDGPEEGDLPNIYAAADGSVNAEVSSESILLSGDDDALKDKDGSALVIHAGEDDHTSQPIGGSGARVACAVIK
jgi:Cu-Zn family superoxide dismutase